MGNLSVATRQKIEELKEEYGITERQARYVKADLDYPELPRSQKAELAGYAPSAVKTQGYSRLKGTRIIKAKEGELAKMAKLEANRQALDANPQQFIESVFLKGVDDPEITANQIKSAENLGKLRGLYVERIEIDPGVALRSKYFTNLVNLANLSEEEED